MIQISITNRIHTAEAATAALVSPRLQSVDATFRPGAVLALAERSAR